MVGQGCPQTICVLSLHIYHHPRSISLVLPLFRGAQYPSFLQELKFWDNSILVGASSLNKS